MAAATVDELKGEIEKGQFLVIVGTGVSIAATRNSAVASWKGLLRGGVERCEATCPPGWGDRIRTQIDRSI